MFVHVHGHVWRDLSESMDDATFEELDGGLTVIQQRYNNDHNYHNDNSNNPNDNNNNNHKIITMIIMIIIMSHECISAMYSPRHAGGLFRLRGIDSWLLSNSGPGSCRLNLIAPIQKILRAQRQLCDAQPSLWGDHIKPLISERNWHHGRSDLMLIIYNSCCETAPLHLEWTGMSTHSDLAL